MQLIGKGAVQNRLITVAHRPSVGVSHKEKFMIETTDLILKKADFSDWKDLYTNVWSHAETARYMLWDVTDSQGPDGTHDRMAGKPQRLDRIP